MPTAAFSNVPRNRSSLSRSASSARFRPVMSSASPAIRETFPSGSVMGKARQRTQRTEPSGRPTRNSVSVEIPLLLLQVREHHVPIIRKDALDPGSRLFVEALARASPDLFIDRTHVKQSLPSALLHPEDLADVLRHLAEPLLALAQRLLGPVAVGNLLFQLPRIRKARAWGTTGTRAMTVAQEMRAVKSLMRPASR